MPTVAISVDCEAAITGKCYTRELVRVAEEFTVPLTWLIFVSERAPMANISLYHTEYYHRIPAWHEIGLLLGFENSQGYISDAKERADLIRIGKDMLKQFHVKPTSFRANGGDLLPGDVKALEDIGILVDGSVYPGAKDKNDVARAKGPTQPYNPSYDNISETGDAKILVVPVATYQGVPGHLDLGWDKVKAVIENSLEKNEVTHISLSDAVDNADTLNKVIALCKEKGAKFVTLTQLAG